MGKILSYPMPSKEPPNSIRSRTVKAHEKRIILILGLMSASSKPASVTSIELSGERMLNMKLRKGRGKNDKLNICKLSAFELHQVRSVLEMITSEILNTSDTKPIIL